MQSVLSLPNDSIGSSGLNVSPYLLDVFVVMVLVSAWLTDDPGLRLVGLLLAIVLALWAALTSKRLRRYIQDTPRSKIGSAAQGFVELQGKSEFYGNRVTQGFLHGPPCVWHRYTVSNSREQTSRSGHSDLPFVIRDETGACVVNPAGAKVISSGKRSWFEGAKYYRSHYIRHGAQLYVIGEIRSNDCTSAAYNERSELASVLKTWKQDQTWLLEEFDADQNGEIDAEEWEIARKHAQQIARDKHEAKKTEKLENAIRKPSNGLPLLISDQHPDKLAVKFALLGHFNLLVAAFCMLVVSYRLL